MLLHYLIFMFQRELIHRIVHRHIIIMIRMKKMTINTFVIRQKIYKSIHHLLDYWQILCIQWKIIHSNVLNVLLINQCLILIILVSWLRINRNKQLRDNLQNKNKIKFHQIQKIKDHIKMVTRILRICLQLIFWHSLIQEKMIIKYLLLFRKSHIGKEIIQQIK